MSSNLGSGGVSRIWHAHSVSCLSFSFEGAGAPRYSSAALAAPWPAGLTAPSSSNFWMSGSAADAAAVAAGLPSWWDLPSLFPFSSGSCLIPSVCRPRRAFVRCVHADSAASLCTSSAANGAKMCCLSKDWQPTPQPEIAARLCRRAAPQESFPGRISRAVDVRLSRICCARSPDRTDCIHGRSFQSTALFPVGSKQHFNKGCLCDLRCHPLAQSGITD